MAAPLDVAPGEQQTAGGEVQGSAREIQGRSLSQIAWARLKRDRVALSGAVVIVLLILMAILAPVLVKINGHPPNQFYQDNLNANLGGVPSGSFGGINSKFWFGVEPGTGRDIFSRIVYGARISLFIAFFATLVSVTLGSVLGVTAGYFGGWVDGAISRFMDILLAFPQLIFIIALVAVVPDTIPRTWLLIVVIGFFGWSYIGRIIRGQTLSLREKEFVDAAKSLGAKPGHILFKQLLPNLAAPILVYATLILPTNVLTEAALSFLGIGVKPPTASWGEMISSAVDWYSVDAMYFIIPGVFLGVTVLAFNLLGDGLRDALDPRGTLR